MLAADKPSGWTSHDVVAVARRAFAIRRIGHGGTLDPLATGVLPLLIGTATKYVERLHAAQKVYAAVLVFGSETTTDDAAGAIRREAGVPALERDALDAALEAFRGEIVQTPPDHSAVKIEGRRAYAIARAGGTVAASPRTVHVHRLAIASWRPPALRLLVVCGSGTYVRALARDIGRAAGSAAHLRALRRLAVGALTEREAIDPGRIRAASPDELAARTVPADDRLLELEERYRTAPAAEVLGTWEAA